VVSIPRSSSYGFPVRLPRSNYTQIRFTPTDGFDDQADIQSSPGSLSSGQNVWIWQGKLTPRPRLAQLGTSNPLADQPVGAFIYDDVGGARYPVVASKGTISYLDGTTWTALTYVSGTSNRPLSGSVNDPIFGTSVYLPRADTNLGAFTNGVDPVFVWGGPSNNTGVSTLTQAPICEDLVATDTRLLFWNIRYLSTTSQLVTRVTWTVKGNPEDSTSVGAGYQDLLDMRGAGTRCFARQEEVLLATDQEIWRGRSVGPPFDFQFEPLSRVIGMPSPRGAINTPDGLFWMGNDFMVYRLDPSFLGQIEPVGKTIQQTFHNSIADLSSVFFGYHADSRQLSVYYTDSVGTTPQRAMTLNTLTGTWTPQKFTHHLVTSFLGPQSTGSAGASGTTLWGQLVGTFAAQTLTYAQLGGGTSSGAATSNFAECLCSSGGTVYSMAHPSVQSTDDGTAVLHDATLGPLFVEPSDRRKYVDTIRLDVRADAASTLSVALSPDLGQTFPSEQTIAVSVQSATTQTVTRWGQSGTYHTIRLRSTGGTWEVNGIVVRAKVEGESF